MLRRLLEHELIPEAHAEHRLAPPRQLDDRPAQAVLGQPGQRGSKRPHTGQDDALGALQLGRIGGQAHLRPDMDQRALDRADVAHAVIHDRDQPSKPFDDGTPAEPPGAMASRSARPSALNVASAMWWRLRPRIRST